MPFFKLSVAFFLLFVSLWLIPTSSFAQTTTPCTTEPCPVTTDNYKAPQNANFNIETLEHGLFCEAAGSSPLTNCLGQTVGPNGQVVSYLYKQVPNGGALGGLNNIMVALYTNPPVSAPSYLADVAKGFGFVSPAYAQSVTGSGQGLIKPVLILWEFTRNIAYLAFIIIFMAVGLMIMFRRKINPQTVISVQAALPGLIVGIILVTFSYFISALIIDLSFVGTQVVAQVFIQSQAPNAFDIQNLAGDSNVFHLFTNSIRFGDNFNEIKNSTSSLLGSVTAGTPTPGFTAPPNLLHAAIPAVMTGVIGALIGSFIFPGVGTVIGGLGAAGVAAGAVTGFGTVGTVVGLLVPLVLVIVLIIQFFRLLFALINAYISLLISTVIGPFIIVGASIPGRGKGLEFWWKSLLANSLIFPAVFATFLFAGFILATNPSDWSTSPVLFGGLSTELIRLILAYGIIIGSPAVPDLVKNALGVKDIKGFDKETLAAFGVGAGVSGAVGLIGGRSGINYFANKNALDSGWKGNVVRQWNKRWSNRQKHGWYTGGP